MSWQKTFVAVVAVTAAGMLLFLHDPAGSKFYPRCPFRVLTGLVCPGCGTLRALYQLSHGNLRAALLLNPLTVLMLPVLAGWGVTKGACALAGRRAPAIWIPASWIWALLAVILLFWVLRNLPWYPFSLFSS